MNPSDSSWWAWIERNIPSHKIAQHFIVEETYIMQTILIYMQVDEGAKVRAYALFPLKSEAGTKGFS